MIAPPDASGTAVNEPRAVARERSQLYGFLATVFRAEPTAELIRQVKAPDFSAALAAAGVAFDDDFNAATEPELLQSLAVEYTRLFLGPGDHVAPYSSVHMTRQKGALWGASTGDFMAFIESAGLEFKSDYKDLPDHIGVELEFMEQVALREARALVESDEAMAAACRDLESRFLQDHLGRWFPKFCAKVVAEAENSFYRETAKLAEGFLNSELAALADLADDI